MKIPFTKAHGAKNDFLLSWVPRLPVLPETDLPKVARAICDRHTGVGADGWMLVTAVHAADRDGAIRLFNSDGSEPEISGNGTRCAAALLIEAGKAGDPVRIGTGAGLKTLRLIGRDGRRFRFEMNMGRPSWLEEQVHYSLPLAVAAADVAIVNVGNPQCVVFAGEFPADWRAIGAEIERHPLFPNRTNVSFVRALDQHTIDVRFFERGAGETMSSGTGATGAAAAAVLRGQAASPVQVLTPAGPLRFRWEGGDAHLEGPAEIVAGGEFYYLE